MPIIPLSTAIQKKFTDIYVDVDSVLVDEYIVHNAYLKNPLVRNKIAKNFERVIFKNSNNKILIKNKIFDIIKNDNVFYISTKNTDISNLVDILPKKEIRSVSEIKYNSLILSNDDDVINKYTESCAICKVNIFD